MDHRVFAKRPCHVCRMPWRSSMHVPDRKMMQREAHPCWAAAALFCCHHLAVCQSSYSICSQQGARCSVDSYFAPNIAVRSMMVS